MKFKSNTFTAKLHQSNAMFYKIKAMHEKFGITAEQVREFSPNEKAFRILAMREEIQEYEDATTAKDELDALLDVIVFAMGSLERQGFLEISEEAFDRVMEANCNKRIGMNKKRNSFTLDLVKPDDWSAPNFDDLLSKIGK